MRVVRSLNDEGMIRFRGFLEAVAHGAMPDMAEALTWLDDSKTSINLPMTVRFNEVQYETRLEMAADVYRMVKATRVADPVRDIGLWCWFSLALFDQLCPPGRGGKRRPGEFARWIPELTSFRKYYRHLVLGPFRIYAAHSDDPSCLAAILYQPLHQPGDLFEQIASRQFLVTNRTIMRLITALYLEQDQLKRGSRGAGAGSARRLAIYLNQLERTYDISLSEAETVLAMLPNEYARFRGTRTST